MYPDTIRQTTAELAYDNSIRLKSGRSDKTTINLCKPIRPNMAYSKGAITPGIAFSGDRYPFSEVPFPAHLLFGPLSEQDRKGHDSRNHVYDGDRIQ
jgi:hypothetical protein